MMGDNDGVMRGIRRIMDVDGKVMRCFGRVIGDNGRIIDRFRRMICGNGRLMVMGGIERVMGAFRRVISNDEWCWKGNG